MFPAACGALDAIADAPRMCYLSCKRGAGVNAVMIASLRSLVLLAFRHSPFKARRELS